MMQKNSLRLTFLLTLLLSTFFIAGCSPNGGNNKVAKLKVFSGANQYTLPGEEFAHDLVIVAEGVAERGFFGNSSVRPAVNAPLTVTLPENSALQVDPMQCKTDLGGAARFKIKAGSQVGDHYFTITPDSNPEQPLTVHFTIGAQITGGEQEIGVGATAPKPISVKLVRQDGTPAVNVPVYFKVISSPVAGTAGAGVSTETAHTNGQGEAQTMVKSGKVSGEYVLGVEIADPEENYYMRQIQVRILALDVWKVAINVLGALALFIFGMKLMSDGLMKIAGDRMKKILHFFSRNGIVAVCAGAAVTAVVQSSSATTVMVIGFINAGLLNLTQSIGIIFGANIGTTVTAQLISFNLGVLAMPAIALGMIGLFASKRMVRGWGESCVGFGLIFYGIGLMSSELKVLSVLPSFQHFFQLFDCAPTSEAGFIPLLPVLGALIVSTVFTMLVQSSAAALGIVLALSGGGLINFYTALPLLLGTNIGTTITAFLASLAANRHAKQAALAHFLFNTIGAVLLIGSLYITISDSHIPVFMALIDSITPGDVFAEVPQNIERHIAMAHTIFNVINTIILMPFIKPFAILCEKLIPVKTETQDSTQLLEPHLLATPTAALEQVVMAIRNMVNDSWRMIDQAVNRHFVKLDIDQDAFDELAEEEDKIDRMQADVTEYLVKIMRRRNLTDHQSELIPLLMHCTNDAERIADHTANIIVLAERLSKSDKKLSNASIKAIEKVWNILNHEASSVMVALGSTDADEVKAALKSERKINKLTREFEQENIDRLRKGSCSLANSVIYIELLGELEKLGDHLSNIAERTPEIQKHYINL
ncbi:MAG: Na/Pi cotransporter family protein [Lentisphaerae bacterium]|nr:Na/Pi cotransporter family protein [Lentisphaerota bacterium]